MRNLTRKALALRKWNCQFYCMRIYELLSEAYVPALKTVLREVVDILERDRIAYVMGGANALAIYSERPRTTVDIDFFIVGEDKNKIESVLVDNEFEIVYIEQWQSKFKKHDVEIDLLYVGNAAEQYALKTGKKHKLFDVTVNSVDNLALLWLYLVSDKEQNFVDAIELVRSNPDMRISDIEQYLTDSELAMLDDIVIRARKKVSSRKR